jgi:hypothetical protein
MLTSRCLESLSMPSSRRSPSFSAPQRRPAGPRCHGGVSSLLRLGFGALPQRAAAARASGWCEPDDSAGASIEHVIGMPLRAQSRAASSS